jgi:hypothetical protein
VAQTGGALGVTLSLERSLQLAADPATSVIIQGLEIAPHMIIRTPVAAGTLAGRGVKGVSELLVPDDHTAKMECR